MERPINIGPSFPHGASEWWLSPLDEHTLLAVMVPTDPYLLCHLSWNLCSSAVSASFAQLLTGYKALNT